MVYGYKFRAWVERFSWVTASVLTDGERRFALPGIPSDALVRLLISANPQMHVPSSREIEVDPQYTLADAGTIACPGEAGVFATVTSILRCSNTMDSPPRSRDNRTDTRIMVKVGEMSYEAFNSTALSASQRASCTSADAFVLSNARLH
jgi:hypothetical protein